MKLWNEEFLVVKFKLSLGKFYCRHHGLVDRYGISYSLMATDICSICRITNLPFLFPPNVIYRNNYYKVCTYIINAKGNTCGARYAYPSGASEVIPSLLMLFVFVFWFLCVCMLRFVYLCLSFGIFHFFCPGVVILFSTYVFSCRPFGIFRHSFVVFMCFHVPLVSFATLLYVFSCPFGIFRHSFVVFINWSHWYRIGFKPCFIWIFIFRWNKLFLALWYSE